MILENWFNDIPQQFLDKKKIKILISAFAKQLDELEQVYEDLKYTTTLDNAKGQNLKYIGDILSVSMKEAQRILMSASNEELTDETYRKVLYYKSLQNNCDCTYEDIMKSISLLWDTSNLRYFEDPDRPATVYVALPDVNIDGMDPAVGRVLAIKPAGVSMIYTVGYATEANISGIETASVPKMIFTFVNNEIMETFDVPLIQYRNRVVYPDSKMTTNLITYKKFWTLDGSYLLDGSKELSAEIIEEVL